MDKTLFEKLTRPGNAITVKQSVVDSITRLLNCSGFLDDEFDHELGHDEGVLNSIYPNGLSSIVEQSTANDEQLKTYQKKLESLVLRYEPRVKAVKVNKFSHQGMQVGCHLKLQLVDGDFEQHFVFNQG